MNTLLGELSGLSWCETTTHYWVHYRWSFNVPTH